MIMGVAKQLDLFALHESAVSVFEIIPDEANNGDLRTFIEFAGGVVLGPGEDDPYKIPILDADWYLNVKKTSLPKFNLKQNDIFLPAFIYESYEKERVMNLNNYSYGESSFSKYNANEILRRELPWADLIPLRIGMDTKKSAGNQNSTSSRITPAPNPSPSPSPSKLNGSNKSDKITRPQRKEKQKEKQNVVVPPPTPTITIDLCSSSSSSSSSDSSAAVTHGSPQNRKRRIVSDYDIDSDSSGDHQPRKRSFRHRSRERLSESRTSTASSLSPRKDKRIEAEASSISRQRERAARRQPYDTKEGQAILNYIFRKNVYKRTGGVAIWKDMEDANVGGQGRTYQSLKEHFRKHITKNLGDYKITEEQETKLKKGLKETAEKGRRRNASPRRWR